MSTPLITVGGAARAAGCSEETVRNMERTGVIRAERDSAGRRLFDDAAVETLRARVEAQRARRQAR